jgi:hypothetical protein
MQIWKHIDCLLALHVHVKSASRDDKIAIESMFSNQCLSKPVFFESVYLESVLIKSVLIKSVLFDRLVVQPGLTS